MGSAEKILIVDDSLDDAELIVRTLRRAGHQLNFDRVDTPDSMLAALNDASWDIVIADYAMPRFDGISALRLLRQQVPDVPFILVSGTVGEAAAVGAMREGAQDYILKQDLARLPPAVERELRDAEMRRERVRAEARYRSLFERVPVGVFSTTPDGKVLEANPAFVQMLGFSDVEELKCVNLASLWVHPRDFAQRNALIVRDGVIRDFESQLHRSDGSIIWCAESVRAEYDAPGKSVARFEGVAVDVTDRIRAQHALAEARDAALEAVRVKSEFLANMSHEIRTPLNGIIGMSELLRDTRLTNDQREFADLIGSSADSLLAIVNDILDFSKISAGKLIFEQTAFELVPALEATVSLLSDQAGKKNLELIAAIEADVPGVVCGDPGRLRQVLTNLLGNAVKFTARGEVMMRVGLVGETDRGLTVRFEISDTGIGISPDAQRRLFQPFHQADGSTTRKFGGTGLGLAISAQLVNGMGGKIEITSEVGKGSKFFFEIPFGRAPSQIVAPSKESLSGLRVLVVDDNDTNRRIVERQIANWGIDSASVASVPQALELLRENAGAAPFDVGILDLAMPGMDGLMLAQLIKTDPCIAGTRLLMMSSIGNRGEAGASGAPIEAWLTKPVKQSQLYDSLAALMTAEVALAQRSLISSNDPLRIPRQRVRILVAEDNLINQIVARHQLRRLGYPAEVVGSGSEALAALATTSYSLVLMDCMMPEMDGFAATAELRWREADTGHHTVVVAMTAGGMDGDRQRCLAAGMDDYLIKPVQLEELRALLDHWLKESEREVVAPPTPRF